MAMAVSEVSFCLVEPSLFANGAQRVLRRPWTEVLGVRARPTSPAFIEERYRKGTRHVELWLSGGVALDVYAFDAGGALAAHVASAWAAGWERAHRGLPLAVRVDIGRGHHMPRLQDQETCPRAPGGSRFASRSRSNSGGSSDSGDSGTSGDSAGWSQSDRVRGRRSARKRPGRGRGRGRGRRASGSGSDRSASASSRERERDGEAVGDDDKEEPSALRDDTDFGSLARADVVVRRFQASVAAAATALRRAELVGAMAEAALFDRRIKRVMLSGGLVPAMLQKAQHRIAWLRGYIPPPLPRSLAGRTDALERHACRRRGSHDAAKCAQAELRAVSAALFASEALPAPVRAEAFRPAQGGAASMARAITALLEDPTPLYWVPGVLEAYHLALQEEIERRERTGGSEHRVTPVVPGDPRYRHGRAVAGAGQGGPQSFRLQLERELGTGETVDEAAELSLLATYFRVDVDSARRAHDAALRAARTEAGREGKLAVGWPRAGAQGAGDHRLASAGGGRHAAGWGWSEAEGAGSFGDRGQEDAEGWGAGGAPPMARALSVSAAHSSETSGLRDARVVVSTPFGTYSVGVGEDDARIGYDAERKEPVRRADFAPMRLGYPAPRASATVTPMWRRGDGRAPAPVRVGETLPPVEGKGALAGQASAGHIRAPPPSSQGLHRSMQLGDGDGEGSGLRQLAALDEAGASFGLSELHGLLERSVPSNAELTAMARATSSAPAPGGGLEPQASVYSVEGLPMRALASGARLTPYQQACLAEQGRTRGGALAACGLIRPPERYAVDVLRADRAIRREALAALRAHRAPTMQRRPSEASAATGAASRAGFAPDGFTGRSGSTSPSSSRRESDALTAGPVLPPLTAVERFRQALATGATRYPDDPSRFYGYGDAIEAADRAAEGGLGGSESLARLSGGSGDLDSGRSPLATEPTPGGWARATSTGAAGGRARAPGGGGGAGTSRAKALLVRAKTGLFAFRQRERRTGTAYYRDQARRREEAEAEARRAREAGSVGGRRPGLGPDGGPADGWERRGGGWEAAPRPAAARRASSDAADGRALTEDRSRLRSRRQSHRSRSESSEGGSVTSSDAGSSGAAASAGSDEAEREQRAAEAFRLERARRRPGMAVRLAEARSEARFRELMDLRSDEVLDAKRLLSMAHEGAQRRRADEEAEAGAAAAAGWRSEAVRAAGSAPASPGLSTTGAATRETPPASPVRPAGGELDTLGGSSGVGARPAQPVSKSAVARVLASSRTSGVFGVGQLSPLLAESKSRARRRKIQLAIHAWAMFTLGSRKVRAEHGEGGFSDALAASASRSRGQSRSAAQRLLERAQAERRIAEDERRRQAVPIGILPPGVEDETGVTRRWGNSLVQPRSAAPPPRASASSARVRSAQMRARQEWAHRKLAREDEEPIETEVGLQAWETLEAMKALAGSRPASPLRSPAGSSRASSSGRAAALSPGSLRSGSGESAASDDDEDSEGESEGEGEGEGAARGGRGRRGSSAVRRQSAASPGTVRSDGRSERTAVTSPGSLRSRGSPLQQGSPTPAPADARPLDMSNPAGPVDDPSSGDTAADEAPAGLETAPQASGKRVEFADGDSVRGDAPRGSLDAADGRSTSPPRRRERRGRNSGPVSPEPQAGIGPTSPEAASLARTASPVRLTASARSRAVVDVLGGLESSMRQVVDAQGRVRVLGVLSLPVTVREETLSREAEQHAERAVLSHAADALDAFSSGGSSGERSPLPQQSSRFERDGRLPALEDESGSWLEGADRPAIEGRAARGRPVRRELQARASTLSSDSASPVAHPVAQRRMGHRRATSDVQDVTAASVAPPGEMGTQRWPGGGDETSLDADGESPSRRLNWEAIASLRGLQLEVLLRYHDMAETVRHRLPIARRFAAWPQAGKVAQVAAQAKGAASRGMTLRVALGAPTPLPPNPTLAAHRRKGPQAARANHGHRGARAGPHRPPLCAAHACPSCWAALPPANLLRGKCGNGAGCALARVVPRVVPMSEWLVFRADLECSFLSAELEQSHIQCRGAGGRVGRPQRSGGAWARQCHWRHRPNSLGERRFASVARC